MVTRAINYQNGEVFIMLSDNENDINHQALLKGKEFQEKYNIDFGNAFGFAYEPERKFFVVEELGKDPEWFDEAKDSPLLSQIDEKVDQIINDSYRDWQEMRLKPFHMIDKNGKVYLPKENEVKWYNFQAAKQAEEFIIATMPLVMMELYDGVKTDPEVKLAREEAIEFLGPRRLDEFMRTYAGIIENPNDENKLKAGLVKPKLERLKFRRANRKAEE